MTALAETQSVRNAKPSIGMFKFSTRRRQRLRDRRTLSRKLTLGDRVCWNGEQADSGTVTAIAHRFVIIKWRDSHKSYTGHGDMKRVELLRK